MKFSMLVRPWHGLVVFAGLSMLSGCGASVSEGDLPPQVPATEQAVQSAQDDIEANMKQMGRAAQ